MSELRSAVLFIPNSFNKSQIRPRQEWMKEGQEEKRASEYLGVEMSIVRAVLFVPIPSTRPNKTWTRADERKERGKARL
jgi:hypothetical protein